jgi:hypothetical protein
MSRSVEHDARNDALRSAFTSSPDVLRANATPDAEVIPAQSESLGLSYFVEEVPASEGAKLHWVGDRSAKNVILYFHGNYMTPSVVFCGLLDTLGGGYGLPIFPGHVIFLDQCAKKLASNGHKTVAAFLAYGTNRLLTFDRQITHK